jgi:hypothetical protein
MNRLMISFITRVSLPLIFLVVVEYDAHALGYDRTDLGRKLFHLRTVVAVIEPFSRGRQPFLVPGFVIAPVKSNDAQRSNNDRPGVRKREKAR